MANSKVKFLQNSAGSYGLAHEGDEVIVKSSVAKELEKAGIAEISGDTDEDETIPQAGSIRIADETGKGNSPAGETDEENPTGKDKPAAKAKPSKAARKTSKK
jgi:hypothetical protein